MIKIKHLMDAAEPDDGDRLWIEPHGLTKDLCEWCRVNHLVPHLGPPVKLWEWFSDHPDGYDFFRARYHEALADGPYKPALQQLACIGARDNFTLLHTGDDPEHNTATALYEFLSELEAYCPPET
jgi:uncharacterized protein YeaO (DUF488 family)